MTFRSPRGEGRKEGESSNVVLIETALPPSIASVRLLQGGELGYALGVSYGAVMDSPDVIAVAVIGDGESETGPTATAWHAHKYLDPAESGAVLPILHVNGYKVRGLIS